MVGVYNVTDWRFRDPRDGDVREPLAARRTAAPFSSIWSPPSREGGRSSRRCACRLPLAALTPGPHVDPRFARAVPPAPSDAELLERTAAAAKRLRAAVAGAVVGQDAVVELMLVTLAARGHALLVGVPGLAKTLLVASLARGARSRRSAASSSRPICSPPTSPAPTCSTRRDGQRAACASSAGPIFHNLVLADEINRTPPKTQAALLEAMQERKVTVGTATHPLPDPFQVFATRNPIEQEGTYPLPEAQLDRFLLEIHVEYPSEAEEREIARRTTSRQAGR